jgi:hypothetical protein
MEGCTRCKGAFGASRETGYYVSEWLFIVPRQFCCNKCKEAYDQERMHEYSVWYQRMWLNTHPPQSRSN